MIHHTATHQDEKPRMRRWKKVLIGTVVLAGIGGAAFAYWSSTGTGTGTAGTGDVAPLTLTQTSQVAELTPGSGTQALSGTFTNPNDAPVYVHHVTAEVTGTDKAGCTAADYTIAGTGLVDANVDDDDTWGNLTIAFNNTGANQDACKGATVTIAYTANAA